MVYKTLKKVSDYCQLIKNGTFQDGFNGWSSQEISYNIIDGICYCTINGIGAPSIYTLQPTIIKYHKYLMSFDIFTNYSNSANTNGFYLKGDVVQYNIIQKQWNKVEKIVTVTWDTIGALVLYINNNPNKEIGDIANFKNIQLFDLTEMYGAGNEPTTVEQFRQDFPEEMYDYKPYCFVKSYKNCLTCTTKNLFDISKVPIISGKLTVKDNSICSYDYPVVTNDTNLLSIFKSLKPNTNYTMSATTLNYLGAATNYIVLIFSNANDSKNIFYNYSAGFNKVTFSLTQEQINNITYVYFYGRNESSGGPIMWSNIQLEEGSTATEYQPYGYIQSRKKSLKVSNSILL